MEWTPKEWSNLWLKVGLAASMLVLCVVGPICWYKVEVAREMMRNGYEEKIEFQRGVSYTTWVKIRCGKDKKP